MTPPSRSGGSESGGGKAPRIDPRIRQRRVAIARHQGRRRLRIVVALVIVAIVVVGGLGLLHTGLFSAKKVAVTGSHPHTPTATILAAAGLTGHPPLISVNPGAVAAKVERLPWIAAARVSRNWPDHVTIAVTERAAAASMAGPGTSWSEVDRTGRTVAVGSARLPGLVDVAVRDAKGPVAPAALGAHTVSAALPALQVAGTLPAAFSGQVTQVVGNADGTVNLALNSGLTVLLGTDKDLHAKYEAVAAIIAGAPLKGAKTIDVTVPQSPTVSSS
ncbi:MAG TPA: FtsQ-type POTRA domain-containing protein [Acidimicrobiales bacterium]|nr:FtsQ-type POTRA domain-containing protein [Acidimicrobiales bacterium]